ncbi:hypothetical protein RE628_10375 [Paenibacillus sp. D2_2]|nr:hypothetical protein [Paenibacillus sp. D2_2]WMT42674.1 hypothetical protein RE628_10375 [Paenibacillus sp. D2_2]
MNDKEKAHEYTELFLQLCRPGRAVDEEARSATGGKFVFGAGGSPYT